MGREEYCAIGELSVGREEYCAIGQLSEEMRAIFTPCNLFLLLLMKR